MPSLKAIKKDFSSIDDLQPLLKTLKSKKVVMLGEASHGTHEYYLWRAKISKKLIEEHGFDFIAIEGDWPPCYLLNRHVKNYRNAEENTQKVIREFKRWPTWMWANWETVGLAQWLREFNAGMPEKDRKGFYGLDVYSLWESLDAIMEYLWDKEPAALNTAKEAMRCFEPYRGENGQRYALGTRLVPKDCSEEVTRMLSKISALAPVYPSDKEHSFSAEQNAFVAKNAEEYYRNMTLGSTYTWNLRDDHMMDTLTRLLEFHGGDAKAIVWAHNTHIGDARYTDMGEREMYNIGQLARERFGRENIALIGFGSYTGKLLAGSSWGADVQEMKLPKGMKGSWEDLCHQLGNQLYLDSEDLKRDENLRRAIPHRAVGVVYRPEVESFGNYVPTRIPERYDHFLFFDTTKALHNVEV